MLDLRSLKIVVTGGTGFVGRHLVAKLRSMGCNHIAVRDSSDNLTEHCDMFLGADIVFHLAAVCGGIGANMARPAYFIEDNLRMGLNVLDAARGIESLKLVMVGTLCSWPESSTLIEPEDLWLGMPQISNAPYGIAKRTIIEVGKAYRQQFGTNVVNVIPTNMYGTGDSFDPAKSHVIPALIRRFCEAKDSGAESVTCWGTGNPTRDFLHVSDAVDGLIRAAELIDDPEPVLLGSGTGVTMRDLAGIIAAEVGFTGEILWDANKPDGQPNRVVSTRSQVDRLGFMPKVGLVDGIRETVAWWRSQQ